MLTQPGENGVAQDLQRIELEFTDQRASLTTEAVRFAQWQDSWNKRQQQIDASLADLKSRLARPEKARN